MLRRAGMSLTEEYYISSHQPTRVRAASGPAGLFAEDTMPNLRLILTFRSRATPLIVGAGLANDYDPGLDVRFDFHLFLLLFGFDYYLAASPRPLLRGRQSSPLTYTGENGK